LAIGDLDRAMKIVRVLHRVDDRGGLFVTIVEHAIKAGDTDRAEQIGLSFPAGPSQTDALNRLVELAIETGSPVGVAHIARKLAAIEGVPTALLLVASLWGADTRFRLLTSAFCMRLRCRSVLVDQAAEDFLASQPSLVAIGGRCRPGRLWWSPVSCLMRAVVVVMPLVLGEYAT
jgi:hypothetical protein